MPARPVLLLLLDEVDVLTRMDDAMGPVGPPRNRARAWEEAGISSFCFFFFFNFLFFIFFYVPPVQCSGRSPLHGVQYTNSVTLAFLDDDSVFETTGKADTDGDRL